MLSRDPRVDPIPGDVLVVTNFGGAPGCRFRVTKIGPHKSKGEQVVCYVTRVETGAPIAHPSRCYARSCWSTNFRRALVAVIAGAGNDG